MATAAKFSTKERAWKKRCSAPPHELFSSLPSPALSGSRVTSMPGREGLNTELSRCCKCLIEGNEHEHTENVLEQQRSHCLKGATQWLCPTKLASQNAPWQWCSWWVKLLGADFNHLNLEPSLQADGNGPSALQHQPKPHAGVCMFIAQFRLWRGWISLSPPTYRTRGPSKTSPFLPANKASPTVKNSYHLLSIFFPIMEKYILCYF